jgi:hypothetical protein
MREVFLLGDKKNEQDKNRYSYPALEEIMHNYEL